MVAGADTRSGSVRAGLAAVPGGALTWSSCTTRRPLAPPALFAAVVEAVRGGADAAVPGVPVTDTVKRLSG